MINEEQLKNRFFYVVKDKDNNLHQVSQPANLPNGDDNYVWALSEQSFDISKLTGFERELLHCQSYEVYEAGHDRFCFGITEENKFLEGSHITLFDNAFAWNDKHDRHVVFDIDCGGMKVEDFCYYINEVLDSDHSWLKAYYYTEYDENNNFVQAIVCMRLVGSRKHELFDLFINDKFLETIGGSAIGSNTIIASNTDESDSDDNQYYKVEMIGGTDSTKQLLRIPIDEVGIFDIDYSNDRYIRCANSEYVKVVGWTLFVDTEGYIAETSKYHFNNVIPVEYFIEDKEYSYEGHSELKYFAEVILEREASPIITTSNQVELYDRFKPTFSQLSFFPVKDFRFSTYDNDYGYFQSFKDELEYLSSSLSIAYSTNHIENAVVEIDNPLAQIVGGTDNNNIGSRLSIEGTTDLTVGDYSLSYGNGGESNSKILYEDNFVGTTNSVWDKLYEYASEQGISQSDANTYFSNKVSLDVKNLFGIQLSELSGEGLKILVDYENETDTLSKYFLPNILFDSNGEAISSEYEYYLENYMSDMSFVNKTVPTINSWCYQNGEKDSYDNPYRLDVSKIFRYNNLSANVDCNKCSINDATHESQYIITDLKYENDETISNDYIYINPTQYFSNIIYDNGGSETEILDWRTFTISDWISYFENATTENNIFEEFFNKSTAISLHNKKYSVFDKKTASESIETLCKGVKFKISEVQVDPTTGNYIDLNTSKYVGYKFSSILIPLMYQQHPLDTNQVYVVVNDDCKFVLVITFFNTLYKYHGIVNGEDKEIGVSNVIIGSAQFSKSYIYCAGYDALKQPYIETQNIPTLGDNYVLPITLTADDCLLYLNCDIDMLGDDEKHSIVLTNKTIISAIVNQDLCELPSDSTLKLMRVEYENGNVENVGCGVSNGVLITENFYAQDAIKTITFYSKISVPNIEDSDETTYFNSTETLFAKYYDTLKEKNAFNIKKSLNENSQVTYILPKSYSERTDYRSVILNVIEPQEVNTYNFFIPNIVQSSNSKYGVNNTTVEDIVISENTTPKLETLARYSGYYEPSTRDILLMCDVRDITSKLKNEYPIIARGGNIFINNEFTQDQNNIFATIKNVNFHKCTDGNTLSFTGDTKFPMLTTYPIDKRNINIFEASWDPKYFVHQKSLTTNEQVFGTRCMTEHSAFFGSKVLQLPDEIFIDTFGTKSVVYDKKYIDNPSLLKYEEISYSEDSDSESDSDSSEIISSEKKYYVMYDEVSNQNLNLYIMLYERIVDYFVNSPLAEEFEAFILPKYSFNDENELRDDIEEYVKKNIISRYEIVETNFWIKAVPQTKNNNMIDNDYDGGLGLTDEQKIAKGFVKQDSYSNEAVGNTFNRKFNYRMKDGWKETFGMSFKLKLI